MSLFTHQKLAETLVDAGADYVLPVKGNQPELLAELTWLFDEQLPASWSPDLAESVDWEHGRREVRRLTLLEPPAAERLPWSHARQYYCLERTRRVQNRRGEVRSSVKRVYGITSLPRSQANAARMLQLIRGHWGIENRSHWIRDVVMREDESRVVTDNIVRALHGLRCAVLTLLHRERCASGARSVAATLRRLEQQPLEAARLVLEPV
jgi:predicted transposase YbfD/YdcC